MGGKLLCSGLRSADMVEIVPMTTAGRLDLRPSCRCGIEWMCAAGVCVCEQSKGRVIQKQPKNKAAPFR